MKNFKRRLKSLIALTLGCSMLIGSITASADVVDATNELGEDSILSDDFERLKEEAEQNAVTLETEELELIERTYAASENSISVTLNVGDTVTYNSYSTRDYSLSDGTTTFCLEPSQKSPSAGGYTASRSSDQLLSAMMYYGYGGPGYMTPDRGLYYLLDEALHPYAYVLTHMALSYIFDGCSDSTDAFTGASTGTVEGLKNIVSVIDTYKWEVPSNYKAYTFSTGSGNQAMGFGYYEPEGSLNLVKTSANPSITDGNSCYSLAGAVYGVFSDDACTSQVETLTTDDSGNSNTVSLVEGNYWVKEQTAPKGYALDTTVYPVTVTSGQTATVQATDEPLNDPVAITLEKVDKDTGEVAQGTASLAGAQFTIKYYDGYYDKTNLPENATRTWVIETKEVEGKYITRLSNSYKISGDELYLANGTPTLPLGTITIEETKAPDGYLLDGAYLQVTGSDEKIEGLYVAQIQSSDDGVNLTGGNTFTMSDSAIYGGVKIQKYDYDTQTTTPQGEATLQGAEIEIINMSDGPVVVNGTSYAAGQTVLTLTTDASGTVQTGADTLPYGDYKWKETKAPTGYQLSGVVEGSFSIREDGVIVDLTAADKGVQDKVIRGGVKIQKYDYDTKTTTPQGEATLEGAEIEIINMSDSPVIVNGTSYAAGQTVLTLTTDASGTVQTEADTLPYGDYKWKETKAPAGYQLSGVLEGTFSIRKNGVTVNLTAAENGVQDKVIRGGVKIQKYDYDTKTTVPQGEATLEGAEFSIINMSKNAVYVNGKLYASGKTVMTITTDENGLATTTEDALPYGDYKVVETKAPTGYQKAGTIEREFSITKNGVIVNLTSASNGIQDKVIRGGVKIQKRDYETGDNYPLGGATLEGAEYIIVNESKNPVIVNGVSYANGETVITLTSDENGFAATEADTLPYGNYALIETKAPTGYLLAGVLVQNFSITENGVIVDLTEESDSIMDQVKRGDFELRKIDSETQDSMAGVEFSITNLSTGETHHFTTDENGYYSSESSWNLHSNNTNGGGAEDGLWFGQTTGGAEAAVNDSLGALPYGVYSIDEIEGINNAGKEMFHGLLYIRRNGVTIDLGNIENYGEEPEITIDTKARDAVSGSWYAVPDSENQIVDEVSLEGLVPGREYTVKGVLMEKETKEPLLMDGKEVTAEYTFTAETATQSIEMTFTFDGSSLSGKEIVAFETIYYRGVEKASHENLKDTDQTVYFPVISTTMFDAATESHIAYVAEKMELTDYVSYEGLQPGKEYTMKGVLMDKDTGEALLIGDEEVTTEVTFTPDEAAGEVELTFTFDGSALAGKTVVAFETCFVDGIEIASHCDITDGNQTVQIPKIGTTLMDKTTDSHMAQAQKKVTLTDKVSYENLIPGKEYTIKGVLMDKDTGEALLVDGKKVTSETVFTPDEASGSVEVTFTFDGSTLAGKTVVAFETCYFEDHQIAVHADIEDVEQTVQFPGIGTELTDNATDSHMAKAEGEITLTDKVSYENLIPGEEYTMKGVLMDKDTGEALSIDGKEITAETVFTPEKAAGEVEMTFTFDGSALAGKKLVAYETCYYGKAEIAVHRDIEDVEQTVQIPKIKTELTDNATEAHVAQNRKKVTLTDKVSYENLIPGEEYTMKGVLMDKATGEALSVDGKEVTAEAVFTPEKASGSVELKFTFDGSALAGETVVAYETCYYKECEVAVHTDIEDADQTVQFPEIETELTDNASGTHTVQPTDKIQLTDKVSYKNLIPGKEYTMKGVLMDKDTGEALLVNGEEVTAELTFTPEKAAGEVEMTFTFDGSALAGKTVVAYETCYYEGKEVAAHHDIEDEKQSVSVAVPPQEETPQSPATPNTGDGAPLGALAGILLGGAAIIGACVLRKKKKQTK